MNGYVLSCFFAFKFDMIVNFLLSACICVYNTHIALKITVKHIQHKSKETFYFESREREKKEEFM